MNAHQRRVSKRAQAREAKRAVDEVIESLASYCGYTVADLNKSLKTNLKAMIHATVIQPLPDLVYYRQHGILIDRNYFRFRLT